MTNIAVILAAGSGKRMGGNLPKQFLPLSDGRSVLEHAVSAFRQCDCIDDILVVMHPDYIEQAKSLLSCTIVAGGAERWESSWNAIQAIVAEHTSHDLSQINILIHDAARPFVSQRIIQDVCLALQSNEAVTVAIPAVDTMYEVHDQVLQRIPDRRTMMRAQTPQAFRLTLIQQAYQLAIRDPQLLATDDCGIVHKYLPQTRIAIVQGEENNRKITFKEDLAI